MQFDPVGDGTKFPDSGPHEQELAIIKLKEEINKIISERSKADAEAKKINIDTKLAMKQIRLSFLSTLISMLVPVVAMITVLVTVWNADRQSAQARRIEISRENKDRLLRDETQWGVFENSFDTVKADQLFRRPTFIANLMKYSNEINRKDVLQRMMRGFLSEISSSSAFYEVYDLVMRPITSKNIDLVIAVARSKFAELNDISRECRDLNPVSFKAEAGHSVYGICSKRIGDDTAESQIIDSEKRAIVRSYRLRMGDLNAIINMTSNEISKFLRENNTGNLINLDLSRIFLTNADLSGVDFSKFTMYGMVISEADLTSVTFTSSNTPGEIVTSNWWDARAIEGDYLDYLIDNNYPGSDESLNVKTTFDQYAKQISRLCKSRTDGSCGRNACLKFGPAVESTKMSPCLDKTK